MTSIVKNKTGLIVPPAVQHQAGFKAGDVVEFKASGGVITILPKLPNADDEYTPEQRRIIDAQLREAEKGPFHGPFDTADEMIAHLKGELKKRAALKKSKRSR
jgi:bifunctional DNA-binding transcriptional regulator/antitoxin component of YhaV-PrlF toxin-antitoxin module